MKVIISGSRSIKDLKAVERAVAQSDFQITELVHGEASQGVDVSAALLGYRLKIPVKAMPARWDDFTPPRVIRKFRYDGKEYNAAAGSIRNEKMAQYVAARSFGEEPGGLVAVWNYESPGTANMIANGIIYALDVFVYDVRTGTGKTVDSTHAVRQWAKDVIAYGFKVRRQL